MIKHVYYDLSQNMDPGHLAVRSQEPAPYYAHMPGYYEWDIERRLDRKIYSSFAQGQALFTFQEGTAKYLVFLVMMGMCLYG